ncbi:MAG: hybrid sensor histidine kinase/response regulator [Nitrospirota bacterium]
MSEGVSLRILAIDDERAIQSYWQRLLPKFGHQAVIAANGTEGLKLARSQHFDLVITDLSMPGLQGQQVLETIREESPGVDVIVATGNGTLESAVYALRAGAHDFLVKPFAVDDVRRILDRQVEKRRLGVENRELRQANERLRELSLLKEKFLAITSHELKTPVTILSAITDLLASDCEGMSADDRREMVAKLAEVSRSLRDIVDGMHSLSEARQGGTVLHTAPTDLDALLEEVVGEMRPLAETRGVTLSVAPVERPWEGYPCDAAKLRQAVRALVRNGIQYTEDGGSVTLHLDAWQADGAPELGPMILVADTGVGIGADQKRLVFDTFYETADTDHHHTSASAFQGGGLGIGLSIVLEVITAHGGRVDLESEPGAGTTVYLKLPPPGSIAG